ncbi:MAG: ABC transporter ATP-binding protein [Bacteroidota bacterium]|nr:ABC transporter ATP-binding protein [Bacteroidota bacterium]
MSNVIEIQNLSKVYRLGIVTSRSLANDMTRYFAKVRGKEDPFLKVAEVNTRNKKGNSDYVWALKNINFSVKSGEILGIIGRNGAGKSTLLKILSRVTSPTSGSIKVKGRIASLLEVGTGFHTELTGRENIYLNGSVLGMNRNEIKRKFDAIVDFSGVERYIDTPVKRYSSGMHVRLAFAVAAHLEPEILIVDEVLAVGDAEFQKKCLGKIHDVSSKEGRTVLFVSHNMAVLSNLCTAVIVLKNGIMDFPKGDTKDGIQYYLTERKEKAKISLKDRDDRKGEGKIRLTHFELLNSDDIYLENTISGQLIKFKIHYECINNPNPKNISTALSITRSDGFLVTVLSNEISSAKFSSIPQKGSIICSLEKLPLTSGNYLINLIVHQNDIVQDWIQEAFSFNVEDGDFYNTGRIIPTSHRSILLEQKWKIE